MMKKILLILTALWLTACSSSLPSLVHSDKPILNMASSLEGKVQAELNSTSASLTNLTQQVVQATYRLYWYDRQGVTQTLDEQGWQEYQSATLQFLPKQKIMLPLQKTSQASTNYRLYLY